MLLPSRADSDYGRTLPGPCQHEGLHGRPPGLSFRCMKVMGVFWRRVLRAVPVQEISIEDGSINVEMDPEDQFQAVQSLERMNMQ